MILRPLHFSQLKHISVSAQNYAWHAAYPRDSASLRKGRATHSYLLGSADAVVECPMPRNEKHAAYRDFLSEHRGKCILSPSEFNDVNQMRMALERHQEAMRLLEGEREVTRRWEWCGVQCEGTPDVVRGVSELVELKTSKTAHPEWFPREAARYGYHAQVAWYEIALTMGDDCGTGGPHNVVVVESKPPYHVTVFDITGADLEAGRRCIRLWLEKLLNCERSGRFPGYVEGSVPLGVGEEDVVIEEDAEDDD